MPGLKGVLSESFHLIGSLARLSLEGDGPFGTVPRSGPLGLPLHMVFVAAVALICLAGLALSWWMNTRKKVR